MNDEFCVALAIGKVGAHESPAGRYFRIPGSECKTAEDARDLAEYCTRTYGVHGLVFWAVDRWSCDPVPAFLAKRLPDELGLVS